MEILLPRLGAQPVVPLDQEAKCVRIDRVSYRRCSTPRVDLPVFEKDNPTAIGRTYASFIPQNVSYPESNGSEPEEAEARRGGYFDIWDLFSEVSPSGPHAIALEFTIEGPALHDCFLSLGCNDCCIVFIDRKPVWGIVGGREHCLGQNIIPVALTHGRAQVSLVFWKNNEWTSVPKDHFGNEWAVNVGLCPTNEAAWTTYRSNSYHFLDTPVVKTLGDLRFDVTLEAHNAVTLYDLKGAAVMTGRITTDGKFASDKSSGNVILPFVGIISMGTQIAEAVVVEGDSSLEAMIEGVLANGTRQVTDWSAWEFRCNHLLKPEYLKSRDRWWARKVALAFATAGLQAKLDRRVEPFRSWSSSRIEFRSYQSTFDGTTQHFRALIGPPKDGQSRPVAVFLSSRFSISFSSSSLVFSCLSII